MRDDGRKKKGGANARNEKQYKIEKKNVEI